MKELETIVKETIDTKVEAEQQVFDKCLRLIGSNKTQQERELGFCLLARMVSKSSPQTLRSHQSRLANRFAQVSDSFSFSGSLFVREVLVRNPQAGDLHSAVVSKIIENAIDVGTESNDKTIRALAAELFALRVNNSSISLIINTLDVLLSSENIKNTTKDILQLATFGISSHRLSLITLLFECLALSMSAVTKIGVSVNRNDVIRVIELGIKNHYTRNTAFLCLRSLCANAKYSLIPLIGRIVSSLIGELNNPDVDLIKTLSFISTIFGPVTSTLHKHFYVIFTALKHPIHEQKYGLQAANLLSTIIEGSGALIKPEVFMAVQKSICEYGLRYVDCPIYHRLLGSLMALNNEYVPSPLQVARIVSSRSNSHSEDSHRLKSLCDVATRPRITDIANIKAKKAISLKEQTVIENPIELETNDHKEDPKVEDDDDDDIQIIEDEEPEQEEEEVQSPIETPAHTIVNDNSARKKKSGDNSQEPSVQIKKKKVTPREVKTDLLEGEASVDDILNFFDPS